MEASPEQTAEGLAIVQVLAAVLDQLVCANAPIARADPGQVTKFHAMKAPGITIQQYLERIHKYASCSNESFILGLIYIDRLIQRNNFLLTELNVHRVVITAILLAAKFFDDAYYNNAYYAKVGGVLVSEINGLEVDFLFRINFSLHVTPEEFQKYKAELISHAATVAILSTVPTFQPPVQVSPEVAPAPVTAEPLVDMECHCQMEQQVTPSPPPDHAPHVVEDHIAIVNQATGFPPLHRANSLPPISHNLATTQQHRAQSSSVPVKARCNPFGTQPVDALHDPYNVVVVDGSHGIYPVHRQHGAFAQGATDSSGCLGAQGLVQGRMLAGLSGVGL